MSTERVIKLRGLYGFRKATIRTILPTGKPLYEAITFRGMRGVPEWMLFWAKVDQDEDCWTWIGFRNRDGYGTFTRQPNTYLSHVWAYNELVGPVPDELELDHLCRNRACVNPRHLEPVTARVNLLRGIGFTGVNARKTQCVHGHSFNVDNTIHLPNGHRKCRICDRARKRKSYYLHKAPKTSERLEI